MHREIWWEKILKFDYNNREDFKMDFKKTNSMVQTWKKIMQDLVRQEDRRTDKNCEGVTE